MPNIIKKKMQESLLRKTIKYNKLLSFRNEDVTRNGTLKEYFSLIKDLCTLTRVTLLQIPIFRVHRKIETLAPSAMIDSHCKATQT